MSMRPLDILSIGIMGGRGRGDTMRLLQRGPGVYSRDHEGRIHIAIEADTVMTICTCTIR